MTGAVRWLIRNWVQAIVGGLLLILLIVWGAGHSGSDGGQGVSPGAGASRTYATTDAGGAASGGSTTGSDQHDGLSTIAYDQLPQQAKDTLRLISEGGPYPYHQDHAVFQNRERVLPQQPRGYYHEFTVVTPGSADRGARRIIMARDGSAYYTDDHYAHFRRIQR